MINSYVFPKMKYLKNETSFMYIFFDNGDFLEIKSSEIINFSINVYDKLIKSHLGFNPVVESGYFKLKICNKTNFSNSAHFLYNESEFIKDRKSYIENRCTNEGRITQIWLFDSNCWHKVLHCEGQSKKEDEFLIINFLPQPQMGSFSNGNHYVNISNLKKDDVNNIYLDFENCEGFAVYNDEIEEINLVFDNQLEWCAGDLNRKAIGGYIKIKLNKDFSDRKNDLFDNNKKLKIKDYENRLCGKKGEDIHDICNLYIDFYHAGYGGNECKECVTIEDAITDEEIEILKEKENSGECAYCYKGGYCKKTDRDTIIIAFGKNAQTNITKL